MVRSYKQIQDMKMQNRILEKKKTKPTFAADILQLNPEALRYKGKVFAIGEPSLTSLVKRDLEDENIKVEEFKTVKKMKEAITGSEEAIVYCAPLLRSEIISVHRGLRKKPLFRELPFFAIVPNWANGSREREMYKRGIRMVFEWPRERKTFSTLFSTALEKETLRVRSEDTDRSLRRAVINRMISKFGKIDSHLDISVYNSIVIARGALKSIGEKQKFTSFIKHIPGVRGVIDNSLKVEAENHPSFVKTRANQLIEELENIPSETMMVRVGDEGEKITLVGTAASINTVEKAKKKLQMFRGIKKVISEVEISPRKHARDLALAKRAQNLVNKITIGSPHRTQVKILLGDAFLKGNVTSQIESSQVEAAIRELSGVKAVVNRLNVNMNTTSMNQ